MILLAQTAPDVGTVEPWLKVFFWLAGGVWLCVKILKELRGAKPADVNVTSQPIEVKKHGAPATDDDMRNVHGRIGRERQELDLAIAREREAREKAVADLKAEDLRLREKLDGDIDELNARIDSVPERTIKLLRETKGLLS